MTTRDPATALGANPPRYAHAGSPGMALGALSSPGNAGSPITSYCMNSKVTWLGAAEQPVMPTCASRLTGCSPPPSPAATA